MAASKNRAFSAFYREHQSEYKNQGRNEEEIFGPLKARFDALSDAEKLLYENREKEKKRLDGIKNKKNTLGEKLCNDTNLFEKLSNKFDHEISKVSRILDQCDSIGEWKFYLLNFQILCHIDQFNINDQPGHVPVEVGLIECTLKNGITKQFHKFIKPYNLLSDYPQGILGSVKEYSEDNHKIPMNYSEASNNFFGIWNEMINFINPNAMLESYPPMFTIASDEYVNIVSTQNCINFLSEKAKVYNRGQKTNQLKQIYELSRLFKLLAEKQNIKNNMQFFLDLLTSNRYEYMPRTFCEFHLNDSTQSLKCAIGTVRRWAYAMFENLCPMYGYEITEDHISTITDEPAVINNVHTSNKKKYDNNNDIDHVDFVFNKEPYVPKMKEPNCFSKEIGSLSLSDAVKQNPGDGFNKSMNNETGWTKISEKKGKGRGIPNQVYQKVNINKQQDYNIDHLNDVKEYADQIKTKEAPIWPGKPNTTSKSPGSENFDDDFPPLC